MRGLSPFAWKWGLTPFLVLLAGCGFHLQGRQPLPAAFAYTYVDTKDEQTDFVQDLRKALIASGVEGDPHPGFIGRDDQRARRRAHRAHALGVGAQHPDRIRADLQVEFSVSSGGKTLIDNEEISATRDISFDEAQLLAKEREQEILREALARDLVALVMRRLAAL